MREQEVVILAFNSLPMDVITQIRDGLSKAFVGTKYSFVLLNRKVESIPKEEFVRLLELLK